jgi:hypothetical protein
VVVNLGSQAYDQKTEIDRLIYLLRKGYRPRQVIFLDGWNDLFLARSNMQLWDKVIYHGFSVGRGTVAFTPDTAVSVQVWLRAIPFVRLLDQYSYPALSVAGVTHNRVAYVDGFDFREADFVFRHWAAYGERHRDDLAAQLMSWYRSNLQLLRALAQGYGFRLPIGVFDPSNPFVPARARSAPGYGYVSSLVDAMRKAIAQGELEMIDLAASLDAVSEPRYIDIVHYSPAANRAIAAAILPYIQR